MSTSIAATRFDSGLLDQDVRAGTARARRVSIALSATAATCLANMAIAWLRLGREHNFSGDPLQQYWTHAAAIQGLAGSVTGVLFLAWLYHAYSNASRYLRLDERPRLSPVIAVGSFLVPPFCVILPLIVMLELRRMSDANALSPISELRDSPALHSSRMPSRAFSAPSRWGVSVPVVSWWLTLQLGFWGIDLAMPYLLPHLGPPASRTAWFQALSQSFLSVAAVLCILVVRGIDANQRERAFRLARAVGARDSSVAS